MRWDSIRQDLRYTIRTLRRDFAFSAAAVAIIALGIGANATIFSVVNTVLFRPLEARGPERLAWVANTGTDGGLSSVTSRVANYLDWKRMNQSFEDMAAYFAFFDYGTYNLVGSGEPERLVGVGVSGNFLDFLGVKLEAGRNFVHQECIWNGTPAVILTHGLWVRRFGADRGIIGRSITLNDKATTVVGVLPASFDFSSTFVPGSRVDMIVPFPLTPETDRWGNTLAVIGRLKPGVTIGQAQAEFNLLTTQIRAADPQRWEFGAKLTPLHDHLTGRFRQSLLVLALAVGAVLLIACTNLSNLLLARASSRRREMAVRSALGASRLRLARQLMTESLVLSAFGAAAGIALAYGAVSYIAGLRDVSIPLLATARLDSAAILFAIAAATLTALLFGAVPALHLSNTKGGEQLKDGLRGSSEGGAAWTRNALVVSEVAGACVLLVGAGLLIRSFLHVLDVDLGFRPERTGVWRIETGPKYPNAAERALFFDRLVRAVQSVPGVDSAGITDALPLSRDRSWGASARGATYPRGQWPVAHPRLVDHRYRAAMRIPLLAGRDLSERDRGDSERVIVINEKMARRLWPGRDPLGQIANVGGRERKVVGVVGNVRHAALEQEGGLEVYLPITQESISSVELVVRTRLEPEALAPDIRRALQSIEPSLPAAEFQTLDGLVGRAVSPRRFLVLLLTGFAVSALTLACIGIYGVVSYTVSQRTREIGIRMALGAPAGLVRRQVLTRTLALAGCGIAIGVIAAPAAGKVTESLLFGLQPTDPLTFGSAAVAMLGVAVAAGYLPARRASKVDPMSALRAD